MSRKYLSVAETAKLVRAALKESFPGVKFSVRSSSYSGGASIDVYWTDGPNGAQVGAVAKAFQGAYFDGMIDYKGSVYHTLDGERVRFGADFISMHREHSDAEIAKAIHRVAAKFGEKVLAGVEDTVADFRKGKLYNVPMFDNWTAGEHSLQSHINQALSKHTDRIAKASKTLERVKFAGDDGYGQGTVGVDGKPGNQAGAGQEAARERARIMAQIAAESVPGVDGKTAKKATVLQFPKLPTAGIVH